MNDEMMNDSTSMDIPEDAAELDIQLKKTKLSETYAINGADDIDSVKSRLDEKYLDPSISVKKAVLTLKVNMEANPTEKSPAKITSFAETYKIDSHDDLEAFITVSKERLSDENLILKSASIAFKLDYETE
jgi:hypothetical protein